MKIYFIANHCRNSEGDVPSSDFVGEPSDLADNGLTETENGLPETENGMPETENGMSETENGLQETNPIANEELTIDEEEIQHVVHNEPTDKPASTTDDNLDASPASLDTPVDTPDSLSTPVDTPESLDTGADTPEGMATPEGGSTTDEYEQDTNLAYDKKVLNHFIGIVV